MSIQYFKKDRGGISPASWVQPHIYKDPPKSIVAPRRDRVNIADVQYMVQADSKYGDPTRINEGIQLYARGQNPMVEVSYANAGGASMNTSLGNRQVSNPYKLDAFRPPLNPIETQVPISAPRIHQNYSVTTNPGISPQTIAGEYDKSKVRLMTSQYTLPMGTVRSNLSDKIQLVQERYADHFAFKLNQLLQGNLQASQSFNLDNTRDTSHKDTGKATKDAWHIAAAGNISFDIDLSREVNHKQDRETRDQLLVSATPTKSFNLDNMRETSQKDTSSATREASNIVVSPTWSYNIDPTRDVNNKYVTETKDISVIAASSPVTFTNITVYDPRTNTNVQVEANTRERINVAVSAQAGLPIVFNTNDGKEVKLKDYTYKVVTSSVGNPQLVIYVRQPDITLERNTPLYAVGSNIALGGHEDSTGRRAAENLVLQAVLPSVTATSSVKLDGYDESGLRLKNNTHLYGLQQALPQTSGSSNVSLQAQGYNDELVRGSKVKDLTKLASFGRYEDRVTRPDFTIRG